MRAMKTARLSLPRIAALIGHVARYSFLGIVGLAIAFVALSYAIYFVCSLAYYGFESIVAAGELARWSAYHPVESVVAIVQGLWDVFAPWVAFIAIFGSLLAVGEWALKIGARAFAYCVTSFKRPSPK
jgi:hypothetical protein